MQFRVMMQLDGREVPSSCVMCGRKKECDACAARLTRKAHPRVQWVVVPVL